MAEMAGLLAHNDEKIDSIRVEHLLQRLEPGNGNGLVLLGEAAIIHTRSEIATLQERQPVQSGDGTLCATVLGRPQWGESDRQSQDALLPRELLEFYQARGPAAFRYLWGQWAAAIWDAPRHRLVLSRGWEGSPNIWMSDDDELFTYSTSPRVFDPNSLPMKQLDAGQTRLQRVRHLVPAMV